MSQPRRLEAPASNCRDGSLVHVLAHAAEDARGLHVAAVIDEDFSERHAMEASQVDAGKIRRHVNDLLRRVGVAADTACAKGFDVACRRSAQGHQRIRGLGRLLAATASDFDCDDETQAAGKTLFHAALRHQIARAWSLNLTRQRNLIRF